MLEGYNWRQEQEAISLRWLAWHSALLSYVKDPPQLKEFLKIEKPTQETTQPQTWQEMKATMQVFAAMMNQGR